MPVPENGEAGIKGGVCGHFGPWRGRNLHPFKAEFVANAPIECEGIDVCIFSGPFRHTGKVEKLSACWLAYRSPGPEPIGEKVPAYIYLQGSDQMLVKS